MSDIDPPGDPEQRIRSETRPLDRIRALVQVLRGPGGCPWDREQTVESMTPYLQEETYEVVEAVAARDPRAFTEELGDLLFLVLLLAEAGTEQGWGTLEAASDGVVDKLIRRHPHVFGETGSLETDGALRQWEEIKQGEKSGEAPTVLGKRPAGLPALTTAFRISEKAGAVGFQWPTIDQALAKVEEELGELRQEIRENAPSDRVENELGDVLYSVANLARYLGIDPERALRGTTAKFMHRFRHVERQLAGKGLTPGTSTLEEMDALWREAKGGDREPPRGES